ncbi:ABC transporter permease [Clostridium sp. 'White wine YQ']|uniref:ABC transporter permease n=1 Tax=Clostridium sp. 'White wine YQ' TaxID=3027474 RepID=UPI002365E84F|nr:ABC transporter permease [Clostridium sp. 'White wine YQ']MDD7795418.1 ABC transporter permease [Clostridium sp. 'White wine YQ']
MILITREINALVTIAARELMRLLKSPGSIIANMVFPMIFLGFMGGSLSQNLAGNVGYNFLQFVMIGMIVFNLYLGTASGITSLVAERDMNLTQEFYVAPISRYTIILGKMIGTSLGSLVSLIGVLIVAIFMKIPFGGMQMLRLFLITPIFCLVGASLGMLFIGFVQDVKVAQMGAMIIVMPQMFFSGTIIPISHSTGIIAFLAKLMPLTYLNDLARSVFYWQDSIYELAVLHHPLINISVIATFFLAFSIIGTIMFMKSELNR